MFARGRWATVIALALASGMAGATFGPAHADESTATFTLSAPATVPPNAAIDVVGSLTDAGVPQAGATVYWSYFCRACQNVCVRA